jgi:AcrR family transcriptional regulator
MPAPRGRPRSAEANKSILDAAYWQLEKHGYARFSIEAVARRAKVSKVTIYRRWQSGASLLLAALVYQTAISAPLKDTGSFEGDFRALLSVAVRGLNKQVGPLICSLIAEAQRSEPFRREFRDTFIKARRANIHELLDRAVKRGELAADIDQEFLIDTMFGVSWYRLLIGHAPLDDKMIENLLSLALACRQPPARTKIRHAT